jgi:hypothetical protein
MRSRWTALLGVLVLAGLAPREGNAQAAPPQTPPRKSSPVAGLKQNYPNPMNPETWIPFTVGDFPTCNDAGHKYSVSLKIFNTIQQVIAIPLLQSSNGVAGGQQITNLQLPCGSYTAYWNGKVLNTQHEAASGIYLYELGVDGQKLSKKMWVAK